MDVVEVRKPDAVEVRRRVPFERRPVFVHEGVVGLLRRCEINRESVRGSALQHMLKHLNAHCDLLSPSKLVETLRILSDNHLFDLRTLHNLYSSVARNLMYFTSSQHRTLLCCMSKCMVYSVQRVSSVNVFECGDAIAELERLLYGSHSVVDEEAKILAEHGSSGECSLDPDPRNYNSCREAGLHVPTNAIMSDALLVTDTSGEPVRFSDLNSVHVKILNDLVSHYNASVAHHGSYEEQLSSLSIQGTCLENMMRHRCSSDSPPVSLLESTRIVLELLSSACHPYDRTALEDPGGASTELLRYAEAVSTSISLMLLDKLPLIRNELPCGVECAKVRRRVSLSLKVRLLDMPLELNGSFINGDSTLFHMVVEAVVKTVLLNPMQPMGSLSIELQEIMRDLRSMTDRLGEIRRALSASAGKSRDELIRLLFNEHAIRRLLCLTTEEGQLLSNHAALINSHDAVRVWLLDAISEFGGDVSTLGPKALCQLVCLVTCAGGREMPEGETLKKLLPDAFRNLSAGCKSISTAAILCAIESCYYRLGYLHHYAARVMLNCAFERYVTSELDALLMANMHLVSLGIPYNMVVSVNPKSFQRVLRFLGEYGPSNPHHHLLESSMCTTQSCDEDASHEGFEDSTSKLQSPRNSCEGTAAHSYQAATVPRHCIASSYPGISHNRRQMWDQLPVQPPPPRRGAATYLNGLWKAVHPVRLKGAISTVL